FRSHTAVPACRTRLEGEHEVQRLRSLVPQELWLLTSETCIEESPCDATSERRTLHVDANSVSERRSAVLTGFAPTLSYRWSQRGLDTPSGLSLSIWLPDWPQRHGHRTVGSKEITHGVRTHRGLFDQQGHLPGDRRFGEDGPAPQVPGADRLHPVR